MAKKIVRLNERELTQLIKSVIKESPMNDEGGKGLGAIIPGDEKCKKQTSQPNCSEFEPARTVGGKIFNVEGRGVVMMVTDESGCPKLCRVGGKELYKLS
jgi:hypothetical protein